MQHLNTLISVWQYVAVIALGAGIGIAAAAVHNLPLAPVIIVAGTLGFGKLIIWVGERARAAL